MRHDLVSLKLFVAIAEELNITRAAEREHIVLSAASKRVTDMEAQAGTALLRRHARGVTLTPAGQSCLHYARQVLHTLARMEAELGDFSSGVKGHVRLHAIASAIVEFMPGHLRGFLAAYPQIKIDLEEQVGPAIVRAVGERAADLGVITANTPADGLVVRPYHEDRLVVVVPADHLLARHEALGLADVLAHDLIGSHPDSSLMSIVMRGAMEAGLTLRLRMQVRSFDGMCRLIEAGLGVGILPYGAIRHQLLAGRILAIPLHEPWARRQILLCCRDHDTLSLSARMLLSYLGQTASDVAADG